jgi:hypothetical protein
VVVALVKSAFVAMREEEKSVEVVACVAWSVVAKSVVEVELVVVPLVPRKLVMTPLVAERTEAKSEVVVACVVVALRAEKSWKVEEAETKRLVVVAETMVRFVTVDDPEFTKMPSPAASGERKRPPSVQLELPLPIHVPLIEKQPPVR